MLYQSSPLWGNCLWFRLGTREPYRSSTSPPVLVTWTIYASFSIQAVGLILNLAAVTEPDCGIQIRGPWVGHETFERLQSELLPRRPRAAAGKRCTAYSTAVWPGMPEPGPCNRDGSASGSRCTKRVSPRRARTAEEPGPCRGIRHNEASRECLRQSERLATDCSTYYAPE